MAKYPSHTSELDRLKKIEGQIRGVQKMITEGRYCVDILQVLSAARGAIGKVEEHVFESHLKGCFQAAIEHGPLKDKQVKLSEIVNLVSRFRK